MQNGYFEFLTFVVGLSDPRKDRGHNHQLWDMVALALCGAIAGANSWADIERFAKGRQDGFEDSLERPYGVPSHDTFSRVFARLDTEEFQYCPGRWVEHLHLQLAGETVAIDGKTDAFDRYAETNSTDRRLRQCTTKEQNRNRHEMRTCMVVPAPAALKRVWPGLSTIGLMHRVRELPDGAESAELSYFISSLPPKVRDPARHLRNHGRGENTLHHTLDVTFTEDASRLRKGSGSEITAVFRRLALSILKSDTIVKDNIRGKRLTAGWNLNKMQGILLAFQAA